MRSRTSRQFWPPNPIQISSSWSTGSTTPKTRCSGPTWPLQRQSSETALFNTGAASSVSATDGHRNGWVSPTREHGMRSRRFRPGSCIWVRLWCSRPFRWSIGRRDFRDWQYLSWLWNGTTAHVLIMLGWTIAGLVLAAALLRTIVYFRDNYRAANYGVPDLIQIIRAIDGQIKIIDGGKERPRANRVQLSFIGHSMGGFVVTNAIRTLSDLFTTTVSHIDDDYNPQKGEKPSPDIGHAFKLMRFVLVSPDIPAEALLSTRGNFLASALRRFDEAYLFSNEGDAVLRQISTLANYFVFPTKSCDYGLPAGQHRGPFQRLRFSRGAGQGVSEPSADRKPHASGVIRCAAGGAGQAARGAAEQHPGRHSFAAHLHRFRLHGLSRCGS